MTQPHEASAAIILYPTLVAAAGDQVVAFRDLLGGTTKARVILRSVQVQILDERLQAGSGVEAKRQRQALASRLVWITCT